MIANTRTHLPALSYTEDMFEHSKLDTVAHLLISTFYSHVRTCTTAMAYVNADVTSPLQMHNS